MGARPKTAHALAQRARIVLACATGKPKRLVADKDAPEQTMRWEMVQPVYYRSVLPFPTNNAQTCSTSSTHHLYSLYMAAIKHNLFMSF